MKKALIVFVKEPIPNTVKTRLVPPLTSNQASDLYMRFIQQSFLNYQQLTHLIDIHYFYAPESEPAILRNLIPDQIKWSKQRGNNLGERMHNAFTDILTNYKAAVIIGSDLPNLPIPYLRKAIEVLDYVDVSIGPTKDGGYYCIGLKYANHSIFDNINWSTSDVFSETLSRINANKLELAEMPIWYDIDDINDLKQFISDSKPLEYPLLYDYLKTIDFLIDLL